MSHERMLRAQKELGIQEDRRYGKGNRGSELREELRQLVSFAGPNGHTRYEAIRGYHDDAVMSLALAVGGLTSGRPRIHVL